MKISMCVWAAAVAVALATTGCRYNKANNGGDGDIAADGRDTGANPQALDVNQQDLTPAGDALQGGTLGDLAAAGKTFREQGYTPCTDVAFSPVYFGFDATAVAPGELPKIEAVVQHLAANPARVVSIEGNCDERGSNEYNMSLGEDRAIVIANFLAQNGISRARIETVSRGETNPAVEGSGESAWSKNRRGEFVILQK